MRKKLHAKQKPGNLAKAVFQKVISPVCDTSLAYSSCKAVADMQVDVMTQDASCPLLELLRKV